MRCGHEQSTKRKGTDRKRRGEREAFGFFRPGLSRAVDFRGFRTMHSSLMLRAGARPEVVRDNMGHANIDVTQNVYGKSWWEERVDAVTRAVEAVSAATENARKAEAKPDQPETVNNEWVPLWVPQQEAKIASC